MSARRPRRPLVCGAILLALASGGGVAAAAPLSIEAHDLNGRSLNIPRGLPSERTLLLVGFHHADRAALDGWRRGLRLSAADPAWLETPVIGVRNGLVRQMILDAMRRGADTPQGRAHLAPTFADPKAFAAELGVDPSRPAAVVDGRSGRILARASGDYAPAEGRIVSDALRQAAP